MAPALRDQSSTPKKDHNWEAALGPAFTALASDPMLGVSVVSGELVVLFINEQAARMFTPIDAPLSASSLVGRDLKFLCPAVWAAERVEIVRRVIESRRPLLTRTIWYGHQLVNWVQLIDSEYAPGGAVFVISRRIEGDLENRRDIPEHAEVVFSQVMTLGPLDALSSRELEILALIGQGMTIRAIAKFLHRSEKTIEHHRLSIGRKLQAKDRAQLIEHARLAGLTIADASRLRL
ncbi:MAG: helix-turn-helix transcriptional regulator [Phycisphaerales bacterium]|nr:helix-turn-helix transcriptional regulator [Phycisphaerales bacterium]